MNNNKNLVSTSEEISEALKSFEEKNLSGLMLNHDVGEYYRPIENEKLLRRYRELQFELARLVAGWIPSVENLELKMQLGRQAYEFFCVADLLNARLKELPGNTPVGRDRSIRDFREILSYAPSISEFIVGVYLVVQREFINHIKSHITKCDPIADWPTIDRLKAVIELAEDQIRWADGYISKLEEEPTHDYSLWKKYVSSSLSHFGGISGTQQGNLPGKPENCSLSACMEPAQLEEGYNVTDEFKFTAPRETEGKVTDLLFQNFAEMFVPDSIAYMVYDVDGMPYQFYKDYIKQIWDECRHICMGIRELSKLGISVKALPINTVKREKPYTTYLARLCYTGEGCSFPRKLEAANAFFKHDLATAAIVTEYDIADESHHVRYAQKWLPELHKLEKCEESLDSIIERVQKESLQWVTDRVEDYEDLVEKLHGKFVKFGAFCKAIDFKIDFGAR